MTSYIHFNIWQLFIRQIKVLLVFFILVSCQQKQEGVIISGVTEGIPDQKISLIYSSLKGNDFGDQEVFATTQIQNGTFEFKGKIENAPIEFFIELEKKMESPPNTSLYQFTFGTNQSIILDNGEKAAILITLADDQSRFGSPLGGTAFSQNPIVLDLNVQGAPMLDEYNRVLGIIKEKFGASKTKLYRELYSNTEASDEKRKDSLQVVIDKISADEAEFRKKYISEHLNSVVAFKVFEGTYIEPDQREEVYNSFSSEVKNSHIALLYNHVKELRIKAAKEQKVASAMIAVGKPYINFEAKDSTGKEIEFSSIVNSEKKYILLDFWASWCGPCLKENPNLLKAYKKYKGKGLEIVGVSLDKGEKEWKKALEKENIPWIQLIDSKAFKGIAKQYTVTAIPDNFLIDCSTGKIVARNLREETLHERLEELF